VLHGTKLRGGFTLVRTEKRSVVRTQKERWILVKQRDQYADPAWDIESVRFERSVLSGRRMMDIEIGDGRKTARLRRVSNR
jgi:bifunctional non-homologous end joining protein LigD